MRGPASMLYVGTRAGVTKPSTPTRPTSKKHNLPQPHILQCPTAFCTRFTELKPPVSIRGIEVVSTQMAKGSGSKGMRNVGFETSLPKPKSRLQKLSNLHSPLGVATTRLCTEIVTQARHLSPPMCHPRHGLSWQSPGRRPHRENSLSFHPPERIRRMKHESHPLPWRRNSSDSEARKIGEATSHRAIPA